MTRTKRPRPLLFPLAFVAAAVVATSLLASTADARPYVLITNSRPKCVTVTATADSTIVVEYDTPDVTLMEDLEKDGAVDKEKDDQKGPPGSGKDYQWYKDNQRRLEMMKKNMGRMSDITISLTEKGDTVGAATARWRNKVGGQKSLATEKLEVKAKTGQMRLDTTKDGEVEVCVQSLTASHAVPSRVSLNVWEDQQKKKAADAEEEAEKKAEEHLSVVEGTTKALLRKADAILRTADYAKQQEYEFHQQSLAMNRASHYWPMIHVAILFITGVTFAHHMVSFFKTHHI
eukprot:CAMPEP_0183293690 /NCGR_PEP_ID=MMETSP0160_2-20130417/2283_1 /TAXON_ID=2839 ORGANISM="Odontella Sinensis, Strain Grunow 1884" /NCGR_SAMPLE_ID=MMETSP0160_2 /ASSEMBLY_ACC=CAM_ASM_000250 /LENGTH=288 /DNA_ID=CAMNT_0025454849 /DNA_START=41 /DNA_END=907 /DNA_ORIENTATION=+